MTTNHRPEHGTGPSDAQLLDYLRRGAVHTPDGTVIGWVPPTPAVGTGSLTYNDVDGLACRECGTDLLRPGEGDALPWREIRGIIDSHTASQHQAHSGIHPLPEYEPPATRLLALDERGALVCVLCGYAAARPEDSHGTPWDYVRAKAVEHYRKEHGER
jgi:hypothetical protein